MGWSAVISVSLGLALAYLVFSVAASRINEFVAARLQWRAGGLERGLYALFGSPAATATTVGSVVDGSPAQLADRPPQPGLSASAIKNHPIVAGLEAALGRNRRISYLPSRALSAVVLDLLAPPAALLIDDLPVAGLSQSATEKLHRLRDDPGAVTLAEFAATLSVDDPLRSNQVPLIQQALAQDPLQRVRTALLRLPPEHPARRTLLRMVTDAGEDRDRFRQRVEHWFDDEMDRLAGWYKKRVQFWILAYGAGLAVLFNVDTINIAETLWVSPVQQAAATQEAVEAASKNAAGVATTVSALGNLALPIGWTAPHQGSTLSTDPRHAPNTGTQWLLKVFGLIITTIALGFGAPFWFDVLGRIARMRNSGNIPSKAPQ